VPALVQVVTDRNRMATNQWFASRAIEEAARALGEIGPAARAAVPALEGVTNDLRLENSETVAAAALVKISQGSWQPFFDRLKDTSNAQRWAGTADQVGRLGAEAEPAIRLLLGGLRQTDRAILSAAITAIARLHRRPDLCLGPLVSQLSPANDMRRSALAALGEFGSEARPAAREVAGCLRDRERTIREAATNALRQIDPEAPELKPKRR
jgi:HEAT repeat protein